MPICNRDILNIHKCSRLCTCISQNYIWLLSVIITSVHTQLVFTWKMLVSILLKILVLNLRYTWFLMLIKPFQIIKPLISAKTIKHYVPRSIFTVWKDPLSKGKRYNGDPCIQVPSALHRILFFRVLCVIKQCPTA